jgi:hypothetical protein
MVTGETDAYVSAADWGRKKSGKCSIQLSQKESKVFMIMTAHR